MTNLLALIAALKVPLSEVTFWDETEGIILAADLIQGPNVLAQHRTQRGNSGVLCYWMQYYWIEPIGPDFDCPCRGDLHRFPEADAPFWRLDMAGNALPNLEHVREIRNPWYSDAGAPPPCFYLTPTASADVDTLLIFNSPDAVQAGYEVGGRLIGFDFPQRLLDEERSIGIRP